MKSRNSLKSKRSGCQVLKMDPEEIATMQFRI
jgi:hypothetical protein